MSLLFSLLLCLAMMFLHAPANAENTPPPIPKSKSEALGSFKDRIEQENKEKSALQKRIKSINNDLSSTKNRLIFIAKEIQTNEVALKSSEQKIANMERKKSILEDQLNADRASIARLILALERIKRTPPEAMLAMPDPPYETAQSAMIMGSIIPSINRHANKLNKNLEMLNSVTKELEHDKEDLLLASKELKSRHEELFTLLSKRNELYMRVSGDIKNREIAIQKISLQAKNLQDLVKRINKSKPKRQQQPAQKTTIDDGKSRLPISGIIRISYKQKDSVGAISNGITIEGRAGSIIVAPMSGKIQFTGSFKRYGNIIIIEHSNGYHSLIAGVGDISTIVGEDIKSGEPIGILPNSALISRPTLYYELRKDSNPVNPAIKFPDLG